VNTLRFVNEPETLYARLDGHRIAYQVTGDGPIDIVFCSGMASIDAEWDEPEIAHFIRRTAEIGRLIRFDDLGSGASDPAPTDASSKPEHSAQQILAVMEAAGSERAILAGGDAGTPGVLIAAATHPERVAGVVVYHGAARMIADEDYPDGIALADLEMWASMYDTMDVDQILQMTVPSRADDPQFMRWGRKWLRGMASPAAVQAMIRQAADVDVRAVLPNIQAPVLVLHRTGFQGFPMALSRYLANHIPNGRFLELPGSDGPPWFEHADLFIDATRDFAQELVGEAAHPTRTERVMATVLFTDLVSSTERAQQVGDSEWRNLLQLHEDVSRRCVGDTGGKVVKTTGDGILATFDVPGRAIACAATLSRNLERLRLPIRAGIHTGEIEVRDDDVGGIAVHIASRVMAAAAPTEVLVSRTVRDLVVGSDFVFSDRGNHSLKGIDGEWQLFALAN
jgi:class 3 adenylate cyclase/pimeloyl-ACP methyl ester carboxylesterase